MPCLSPFKKYITDVLEAYVSNGGAVSLAELIKSTAIKIVNGDPVTYGIYNTPEYCCPTCEAIDDPCGNFYFLGNFEQFYKIAEFKSWLLNPASIPCCYNFMSNVGQAIELKRATCWVSTPRCCNEFDNCVKTFESILKGRDYADTVLSGILEYGAIPDNDNICFLKNKLQELFPNKPEQIVSLLNEILQTGLVFVCPIGLNKVYVLDADTYLTWCSNI